MKEDITQQLGDVVKREIGCGLVMKEDITQRTRPSEVATPGCGLVMKEDITQHENQEQEYQGVVVW